MTADLTLVNGLSCPLFPEPLQRFRHSSHRNVPNWLMRQFYVEYKGLQKLQPLVGEISWAKRFPASPFDRGAYQR